MYFMCSGVFILIKVSTKYPADRVLNSAAGVPIGRSNIGNGG